MRHPSQHLRALPRRSLTDLVEHGAEVGDFVPVELRDVGHVAGGEVRDVRQGRGIGDALQREGIGLDVAEILLDAGVNVERKQLDVKRRSDIGLGVRVFEDAGVEAGELFSCTVGQVVAVLGAADKIGQIVDILADQCGGLVRHQLVGISCSEVTECGISLGIGLRGGKHLAAA